MKIYNNDIKFVCSNGAVICCPGLFSGEMIVMNSVSHKSITITMNALAPDIEYAVSVFYDLVQRNFSQCITYLIEKIFEKINILMNVRIKVSFFLKN